MNYLKNLEKRSRNLSIIVHCLFWIIRIAQQYDCKQILVNLFALANIKATSLMASSKRSQFWKTLGNLKIVVSVSRFVLRNPLSVFVFSSFRIKFYTASLILNEV